jgi:predicted HNH restriction endonuclease
LERKGLASFADGKYYITGSGRKFGKEAGEALQSLVAQGFSDIQRQDALDKNFHGLLIEEGDRTLANRTLIRRSSLLKKAALKHFSDNNGSIACSGCGFRAEKVYGPTFIGMIEIHHTKPLYLGRKFRTSIKAALKEVVPLSSNCHRIVHSDRSRCMAISELKCVVAANRSAAD